MDASHATAAQFNPSGASGYLRLPMEVAKALMGEELTEEELLKVTLVKRSIYLTCHQETF